MWLSGLHIPESYLTAMVQAACWKYGWPLDLSTLYTEVTQYHSEEEVCDKPKQGDEMAFINAVCLVSGFEEYCFYCPQAALCLACIWREQSGTLRRAAW